MHKAIDIILKTRISALDFLSGLSIEQLNQVPAGFNNNIIWNVAHMIAAQQGVCYLRGGEPMVIEKELYTSYKPDTKPERSLSAEEVDHIKELFLTTLDRFNTDYESGLFKNYRPWTTRYGVDLGSIEEAIQFMPFHEGLHLGYIMALRRVVG